jgi:hypothetical protein
MLEPAYDPHRPSERRSEGPVTSVRPSRSLHRGARATAPLAGRRPSTSTPSGKSPRICFESWNVRHEALRSESMRDPSSVVTSVSGPGGGGDICQRHAQGLRALRCERSFSWLAGPACHSNRAGASGDALGRHPGCQPVEVRRVNVDRAHQGRPVRCSSARCLAPAFPLQVGN